jgi:hypothetical protein
MAIQTDVRAGTSCYKCGLEIELEIEIEIDFDLNFGHRKRHKKC